MAALRTQLLGYGCNRYAAQEAAPAAGGLLKHRALTVCQDDALPSSFLDALPSQVTFTLVGQTLTVDVPPIPIPTLPPFSQLTPLSTLASASSPLPSSPSSPPPSIQSSSSESNSNLLSSRPAFSAPRLSSAGAPTPQTPPQASPLSTAQSSSSASAIPESGVSGASQVGIPSATTNAQPGTSAPSTMAASIRSNHTALIVGLLVPLLCIAVTIIILLHQWRRRCHRRHAVDPTLRGPSPFPPLAISEMSVPAEVRYSLREKGSPRWVRFSGQGTQGARPVLDDVNTPSTGTGYHTRFSRTPTLASFDRPETPLPRYTGSSVRPPFPPAY
ncbi:hypothetical protein K438DRAFT_1966566 [Mycena galopus ATCC 62051]|nr:hypothetical protein K438DRAFT_1966566 [Mycena galopus ATCC 62051]